MTVSNVEQASSSRAGRDVWLPSSCSMCLGGCSTLVHRVDGVVVKVEGNPDSPHGRGHLCAKGVSAIMTHYDPNRLRVPLRRTNPKKGLGIDPGWKEITWDEALDEISARLKKLRADDPRKLSLQRTTTIGAATHIIKAMSVAFGTPNQSHAAAGIHCGDGSHIIIGVTHGSWNCHPDFQHCNYFLQWGANIGFGTGTGFSAAIKLCADARERGMRTVVIDPMVGVAAAKAEEWVPIRVGTDGALALAMCNVIANELQMLDIPYLKSYTNGPYLIGPDGKYVRDPATKEPLVWDEALGAARSYKAAKSGDMALAGRFEVDGVACQPAFHVLREHLRQYTPEWAEKSTTIAAATTRRIAQEFAVAARIGSTIEVDGVNLPYRPVASVTFRGALGHRSSTHASIAIDLLNHLVGAADVVGAAIGMNSACDGFPETGRFKYAPSPSKDGLLLAGDWVGDHKPFPPMEPRMPQTLGLQDLFTRAHSTSFADCPEREEIWSKFGIPRPEMLINYGANMIQSMANKDTLAESLIQYAFMVSIDLFLTETAQFADIVLPDCDNLQTFDSHSNYPFILSLPSGMGEWCWPTRAPVVEPQGEQRRLHDVFSEIARRAGFLPEFNAAVSGLLRLEAPYILKPDRAYKAEEVCDAELKTKFGPQRGMEWFRDNGGQIKWPKKPAEVYWRPFNESRIPVYWEFMLELGEKIAAIAEQGGLKVPLEFYQPVPSWFPCRSLECTTPQFDLYAFYGRHQIHTHSFTVENPWLDEAAQLDPIAYTLSLNPETARRKGLKSGDIIEMQTEKGRSVKGRLHLTQGIHPEAIAAATTGGHWSTGLPVAKGKGVFFNDLLDLDWRNSDPVSHNSDLCVKVKIRRVGSQP